MNSINLGIIGQCGPDKAAPYVSGSATSRAAAESMADHLGAQEQRVLNAFRVHRDLFPHDSGLTDGDCQFITGLNPSSQRPRRIRLVEKGLLRDGGNTRRTTAGRLAVVWELV